MVVQLVLKIGGGMDLKDRSSSGFFSASYRSQPRCLETIADTQSVDAT